jgi:hypothetical protein
MKVLAKREIVTPLWFKRTLNIVWSRRGVVNTPVGVITLPAKVCCEQSVALEHPHVIDYAMIVQLSREEAAQLGLVSAIGIIEGKKLR